MRNSNWGEGYFEEEFQESDPWKYFTSPYEKMKYSRQLAAIEDRVQSPNEILEIGSAEGAQTVGLAERFPKARITGIEISARAADRARKKLQRFGDRIEVINADIVDYTTSLEDGRYDVCIWSESVYYIGARLPLTETYDLLAEVVGKLKDGGLLVMANVIDLPEDVPESALTKRPLVDCYRSMISSLAILVSEESYNEAKGGRRYDYKIWAFQRKK